MKTLHYLLAILLLSCLFGCDSKNNTNNKVEPLQKLQIKSISIIQNKNKDKYDDHEIIIFFNRPITKEEVNPGRNYEHRYGIKFWLYGDNGWEEKPWNIKPLQEGLTRKEFLSYLLTEESSYHPLRGYNLEVDKVFTKDHIKKITIELYEKDKNNLKAQYEMIQNITFTEFN